MSRSFFFYNRAVLNKSNFYPYQQKLMFKGFKIFKILSSDFWKTNEFFNSWKRGQINVSLQQFWVEVDFSFKFTSFIKSWERFWVYSSNIDKNWALSKFWRKIFTWFFWKRKENNQRLKCNRKWLCVQNQP